MIPNLALRQMVWEFQGGSPLNSDAGKLRSKQGRLFG